MSKPNGHADNISPFPDEKARLLRKNPPPPSEPVFNLPPVVKFLSLANIAVFLFTLFFPRVMTDARLYALAFVPARYFGGHPLNAAAIFSPVTHMFVHAGWLHLAVNIGTLMAFGAGLEKRMGGRRLLVLYFVTGLCGAFLHALLYPNAEAPMIGASGAISGLFGGVLMMMYDEGMMGQGYKRLLPFILIWIAISVFFGLFGMPGTDNPIAWTTHIGGFIAGLVLYRPVSRMSLKHN